LPPPSFVNDAIIASKEEGDVQTKEIQKLSDEITNKVFFDRKNHFTIFKAFDVDNDGFISYQDFADKVKQLQIQAPTKQVIELAKFIDKDNKGYIDFKTFSDWFNPSLPVIL